MIGSIRLVNPWRDPVWGSYIERLRVTTSDGKQWEIHCSANGDDFYPGRSFSRHEIEAWASAEPLSAEELTVVEGLEEYDLLGKVPALSPHPTNWKWYVIDAAGERRLRRFAKPSAAELSAACKEPLEAEALESVPLIDRFELWVCDLETSQPLALLLTGITELDARGSFSPRWRFCARRKDTEDLGRNRRRVKPPS